MARFLDHRFSVRPAIMPIIAVGLAAYFGYHAIHGDRGILALWQHEGEITGLRLKLADLRAERGRLEHKVRLLRPETIDPDMLDERARASLFFTRKDELTLFEPTR